MTLLRILQDAVESAKKTIIENLDIARERTGELNPYGDKTLLLDVKAEDAIISVIIAWIDCIWVVAIRTVTLPDRSVFVNFP